MITVNLRDLISHAHDDAALPVDALEAAAFMLHMREHNYRDDQAEAAHQHWMGYPEDIRKWGREAAGRILKAALGGAGLVVVSFSDVDRLVQLVRYQEQQSGELPPGDEELLSRLALPERTENA